jgi:hypothetical protein
MNNPDYADVIRAGDVADYCDLLWRKGVGDASRPELAGPEGPEPCGLRPTGSIAIAKGREALR